MKDELIDVRHARYAERIYVKTSGWIMNFICALTLKA